MLNTSFRILNNLEDAEDAIQEAFVKAFNNINTYKEESTFGAWLKRIVINRSLTILNKKERMLVLDNQIMEETEMYLDQDDSSDSPIEVEEVKQAIMRLPAGFRKVLVLYLIEGYDHVEISEILSISISTSKSQYMRAKVKLRSILNEKKHE